MQTMILTISKDALREKLGMGSGIDIMAVRESFDQNDTIEMRVEGYGCPYVAPGGQISRMAFRDFEEQI